MKRVKNRAMAVLLLAVVFLAGLSLYVVQFAAKGAEWVSFAPNKSVFSEGALRAGTLLDREGVVLSEMEDGRRVYGESAAVRKATLHAVGDAAGKIGTGALNVYASKLTGYNPITGVYTRAGEGKTVYLTIDSELNVTALEALDGRRGAVAVMNYKTGELLCMVSSPTFDPQAPPEDVETNDRYEGVYLNRFLSSAYTPGSVYKLITAAAAIEQIPDIYDRTFECAGTLPVGGDRVTCPSAHGTLSFEDALAVSCNCTFGVLALELGPEMMHDYARQYGITQRLDMLGTRSAAGRYDMAEAESIDLAWSGSGQYNTLVSPAAMLRFVSAVANDGKAVQPVLLRPRGLSALKPAATERLFQTDTAQKLAEMMSYNVYRTYSQERFPGLELYAKSGTAEVGRDVAAHAWFAGYITNEGYPLAFVVIIENGGGGLTNAGSVANKVLQRAVS